MFPRKVLHYLLHSLLVYYVPKKGTLLSPMSGKKRFYLLAKRKLEFEMAWENLSLLLVGIVKQPHWFLLLLMWPCFVILSVVLSRGCACAAIDGQGQEESSPDSTRLATASAVGGDWGMHAKQS